MNKMQVFLTFSHITSSFEEVTSLLNIIPTKSWNKGSVVNGNIKLKHKYSIWKLEVKCKQSQSFELYFDQILIILKDKLEAIAILRTLGWQLEVSCHLKIKDFMQIPAFHLSNNVLSVLNSVSAELDFEITD